MALSKKGKIILGIVGGVVVLGGGTWLTIHLINKKKEKDDEEAARKEQERLLQEQAENIASGVVEDPSAKRTICQNTIKNPKRGWVYPCFNRNYELINDLKELTGRTLYPATEADHPDSTGEVNIRTSAEVNTGLINNKLTSITSPKAIGAVVSEVKDDLGMRWFKVKLKKPVSSLTSATFGGGAITEGYVRADNVTINPYAMTKEAQAIGLIKMYESICAKNPNHTYCKQYKALYDKLVAKYGSQSNASGEDCGCGCKGKGDCKPKKSEFMGKMNILHNRGEMFDVADMLDDID